MKAVFTAAVILTLAGCASTPGKLSDAADRLDSAADDLYEEVRRGDRDSDLERDARQLADAADEFNREIEDDDSSREELREEFESIAEHYHALRDELEDERADADERSAFADVTRAYLDLERELQYRRVSGL